LNRAGGGCEHREEAGETVGRDQRRLVPADRRLRGERVHCLRTGDPRDRLHREGDDTLRAQAVDAGSIGQRLEKADQQSTTSDPARLLGVRRLDLDDRVRVPGGVDQRCAGLCERLVLERRGAPGAAFDHDLVSRLDKLGDHLRYERHPALALGSLLRNADPHLLNFIRRVSGDVVKTAQPRACGASGRPRLRP
jgi:hypothetical protein